MCMENRKTISGVEAIRRARNLKYVPDAVFTLIHLTCNFKTGRFGETVKHERCRVRPSIKEDTFEMDGDMYFPYEETDTGEPRMCFKRLMRFIGFPPNYELIKIKWYDE